MRTFIGCCKNCEKSIYYSISNKEDFFDIKCTSCNSKEPFIDWLKLQDLNNKHMLVMYLYSTKILISILIIPLIQNLWKYTYGLIFIGLIWYLYSLLVNLYQYARYPYYKYLLDFYINDILKKSGIKSSVKLSEKLKTHIKYKIRQWI